ncbi:hypothetical protein [Morganella morganii]
MLEKLVVKPDFELMVTDTTNIKVYPHAITGAQNGDQDMEHTKKVST